MRVLHLNTHASGGSYEYAALLCDALGRKGWEPAVLQGLAGSPRRQTFF